MKLKTLCLVCVLSASSALAQTTVTVSTFNTAADFLALTDNAGELILNGDGSFAVGTFASPSEIANSFAVGNLLTDFNAVSNESPTTFGSPIDGIFNAAVSASIPAGSALIGQPIFVVVGDSATLADSSSFAVFATPETFEAEVNGIGSETVNLFGNIAAADVIVGSLEGPISVGPASSTATVAFAAIPEPSSALLAGLALVGGLVRRRR